MSTAALRSPEYFAQWKASYGRLAPKDFDGLLSEYASVDLDVYEREDNLPFYHFRRRPGGKMIYDQHFEFVEGDAVPSMLCHFTSDESIEGILQNGVYSNEAGFGHGLYCCDASLLRLDHKAGPVMSRTYILQNMYTLLSYTDGNPALTTKARNANAFVVLQPRDILRDHPELGLLRIDNGQIRGMVTIFVFYRKVDVQRESAIPKNTPLDSDQWHQLSRSTGFCLDDPRRSLNERVGSQTLSLIRPEMIRGVYLHPEYESDGPIPRELHVWQSPHARHYLPGGAQSHRMQQLLKMASLQIGTEWEWPRGKSTLEGVERLKQSKRRQAAFAKAPNLANFLQVYAAS